MQAQDLSHNGGVVWDELSRGQAAHVWGGGGPCCQVWGSQFNHIP
jgi:hypothetical protein